MPLKLNNLLHFDDIQIMPMPHPVQIRGVHDDCRLSQSGSEFAAQALALALAQALLQVQVQVQAQAQ